jgi:hypothetical protein
MRPVFKIPKIAVNGKRLRLEFSRERPDLDHSIYSGYPAAVIANAIYFNYPPVRIVFFSPL